MTPATSPRLLYVQSTLKPEKALSDQVGDAFVQAWRERHPGGVVDTLDLDGMAMPHFTFPGWLASHTPPESHDDAVQAAGAFVDKLIRQVEAADVLLIGCPMYNFTLPSTLKAWFDHIICMGRTVKYTPTGPVGLLGGRKVVAILSRGGDYRVPMLAPMDHQEPLLRQLLGFLGLTDLQLIHAQGTNMPGADAAAIINTAQQQAVAAARAV